MALWAYCSSPDFSKEVRKINQKFALEVKTLIRVPFDAEYWRDAAARKYPNGLPEPQSDDLTQWLFKGEIKTSAESLQVAVARLLGYRWPDQVDDAIETLIDYDGIVCIPSVRGEEPAEDRLLAVLSAAYGEEWSTTKRDELFAQVGTKGKGLDWWLRHKFFEQHCKMFQHRPFIWHI